MPLLQEFFKNFQGREIDDYLGFYFLFSVKTIQSAEYTGTRRPAHLQPPEVFNNYQLHRRFLGHLSAVYCVLYDRTGNYIFTVSLLILVWNWSC